MIVNGVDLVVLSVESFGDYGIIKAEEGLFTVFPDLDLTNAYGGVSLMLVESCNLNIMFELGFEPKFCAISREK